MTLLCVLAPLSWLSSAQLGSVWLSWTQLGSAGLSWTGWFHWLSFQVCSDVDGGSVLSALGRGLDVLAGGH